MTHPLVDALASSDPAERVRACRRAVDDPAAVVLLDSLSDRLEDPNPRVAMAAADAYAAISARSGSGDERLRDGLRSGSANTRWAAAFAAAQLGIPSARSLPPLVEALACENGAVRWRAVQLLVNCASVLPEARAMLIHLVASTDAQPRVRQMAVHAMRRLDPTETEAAAILRAAAEDVDPAVRRAAASAIAASPSAISAARLLAMADEDADEACARLALSALETWAERDSTSLPPETADALRRISSGPHSQMRRDAAQRTLERLQAAHALPDSQEPDS